ncbi:MAG: hypothetical protein J5781_01765, partial [Clostridia bacterium]|nr:hypothetical protein [Clostridia bacterium]
MNKKILSPRVAVCIVILAVMAVFIFNSDVYMESVRAGASLYLLNVLPATFPFFFFSKLLTELDFANDLTIVVGKPIKKLYRAGSLSGYILVMSMLCGYPVGARLLSEFYDAGKLDQKEVKKIAAFTSFGSPIFIIGTVGVAMFENKTYGYLLLGAHYLGTFFNGFLYRGKKSECKELRLPGAAGGDLLNKSMTETLLSVGIVGGFIVLFNLLIDMVDNTELFSPLFYLSACLKIPSRAAKGFLFGLIEMTRGCKMISSLSLPLLFKLPCCSFLLTFGGLSVT